MTARAAEMMDPQARVLLELAHQALETVGYVAGETIKSVSMLVRRIILISSAI